MKQQMACHVFGVLDRDSNGVGRHPLELGRGAVAWVPRSVEGRGQPTPTPKQPGNLRRDGRVDRLEVDR